MAKKKPTTDELYPNENRVNTLKAALSDRLTQEQIANLEMIGKYIDIFGDSEAAADDWTERERDLESGKKMILHGLCTSLEIIEALSPVPAEKARPPASPRRK